MFNPNTFYTDLSAAALAAGTNITQLCAEAKVSRNTLANWRNKPPKSLAMLGKLYDVLAAKTQPETPAQ